MRQSTHLPWGGGAQAAIEMKTVIQLYNDTLTAERDHFRIRLNGVGLHCGTGVSVDTHGKLFGATAGLAYSIGEDVCSKGCIILSEAVKQIVSQHANFAGVEFKPVEDPHVDAALYEVASSVAGLECEIVPTTHMEWLHPNLAALASRHSVDTDLAKVDKAIHEERMQNFTALMFAFDVDQSHCGATEQARTLRAFELARPTLRECTGVELEECLYVFKNPADAVHAAVRLRSAVHDFNSSADEADVLVLRGCGIHMGNLLFVEGTDIHWGDPVNTSSKLGEDLAKDGDIFITSAVYDLVKDDARLAKQVFTARTLQTSKVEFHVYGVSA